MHFEVFRKPPMGQRWRKEHLLTTKKDVTLSNAVVDLLIKNSSY